MKITIKALLITLALLIAPLAWAQDNIYYPQVYTNGGQITASVTSSGACPPGSCIGITIPTTVTTITVGVLGTFSATLQPEESQNGGYTWTSAGTAITSTGTTVYTVTAFTNFRVRASAYASGVANVNIQAGPTGGNGSAGAGVTSLNGLVGGVTLAAGTGVTLTPSGNTITIASSGSGSTCGSTNGQLLYNASGTCAGTPSITTDGAGDLTVGGEVITGEVLANASVGGNLALTCSPAPCTVQFGTNAASVTDAFTGSLASFTTSTGVTVGSPTGGAEGLGTVNATGLFVNGVAVGTGGGTVTSASFTGGLISVATPTTTPAFTVAGTSGGIPYFSSGTAWASSAALGSTLAVLGGGAGTAPSTNAGFGYSAGTLTCGIAGTAGCTISGAGATSGTATIAWPAVAGTSTNPFVFSNTLKAPNGTTTAMAYGFASDSGSGLRGGSGQAVLESSGNIVFLQNNAGTNTLQYAGTELFATSPATLGDTSNPWKLTASTVNTATNCSSSASPAVCGSAAAGSAAIPAGAVQTLVVNTTSVTANSQILLTVDEGLGTKLGVTCNTTIATLTQPVVTARTAGTSFTIEEPATTATNPVCVSYLVLN